ncbi:DUF4876 domain-containing protein [uncultured Draconibacterium sp.]|uniref:DUF4876 domain-containing protein n=1 Tax=uncultured Draconibacterium sp. TaxID=1573823 RepID=UPI0025F210E4|nr:DUF4876 domain-containing protein [uncultured Draconibacterium sp.]
MNTKINFRLLLVIGLITLVFQSCQNDYDHLYQTQMVSVQLHYPDNFEPVANVIVSLVNSTNNIAYTDSTDADGIATFEVPFGIYDAAVSEMRTLSATSYIFTGNKSLSVTESDKNSVVTNIELSVSQTSAIIIKELYNGGCQKDDGSGSFNRGQYTILYNNSASSVSLDNFGFGAAFPYNSNQTNYFFEQGELSFVKEGWIPAAMGIWYFPDGISLAPGEQIVVAINSAVDNTVTYSQSINFANSVYYTAYDINVYTHELYYPAPSSLIPTSHYLSAVKYGSGSAWTFSVSSPAFFIFKTEGETPAEFANNADNLGNYNGSSTMIYSKVPMDWVLDGIEVYRQGYDNQKRLPSAIDAGYVYLNNTYGYTLYRNVNKEATEALLENAERLVYSYSGGTTDLVDGSTDPSGIDAEASIANGARIIYSDTNSATNDFHQRRKASLRD